MTLSSSSLNRQKLVIIGGNSGIGAAVAYAAVANGASVVLASRRSGCMQHYQPADGGNLRVMQADVTDENSLRALFAEVGEFDHLVFTAGPAVQAKLLADTDFDKAQANFDVKLWGALRAIQAALPTLSPKGSITLTSGQLSRKYLSGQLIKTGINAALEAIGKQLAKELAPRRVNVVSPGVTVTEAYDALGAEQRQAMFAKISAGLPVGRVGQAADVAAGYLLAMENGFITGSVIDIDGGGLL
ncbi:SDR family oxidoreductase [Serratia sp. TSA_7]|uniref:SDR family oxidoreductase n=1 Tax=Serratia TaxID=613 RepID=UPI000561099F|nr:SDR family oxidoreductase [Serratia plymuthica]MBI6137600.1 SDR family oxidoreductase [Serratia plymuthica]NIC25022.1 SDR family oxidoreductase [Serratia plymuthica]